MPLPTALPPGTVVGGHYTIGNLMNSGGFGAVYRGIDSSEGQRPCAIKETYDVTPAARRRALMEASVLFTIRSKQLPEVYDAFETNGRFYLVMQLIEGQNLLQVLQSRVGNVPLGEQAPFQLSQGPCSEQEVLTWLLPIMDVLQELHSRNPPIMHRDIKPGNIILTPNQTTVLVDFGLTRLYDPNINTQTLGRAVTPGFSPLEQYVGKTSPQSDLYSLAATMYLLLTNCLPPVATSRTPQDTLLPPRQLNPALSPKVERALLKALSLHADERFQSMREFAQYLREPTFTAFSDRTAPIALPIAPTAPQLPTQPAPPVALPPPPSKRPTGGYPAATKPSHAHQIGPAAYDRASPFSSYGYTRSICSSPPSRRVWPGLFMGLDPGYSGCSACAVFAPGSFVLSGNFYWLCILCPGRFSDDSPWWLSLAWCLGWLLVWRQ